VRYVTFVEVASGVASGDIEAVAVRGCDKVGSGPSNVLKLASSSSAKSSSRASSNSSAAADTTELQNRAASIACLLKNRCIDEITMRIVKLHSNARE
jgi:hypothetical protein